MKSVQNEFGDQFFVAGGTLPQDVPSYVERQADRDLYESLLQGSYCYVLTSRQMGKSSLMNRTAARLCEVGVNAAIVDLSAIGHNVTVEQWYVSILDWVSEWIGFEDSEVEEFWKSQPLLSPLRKWIRALREIILPHCPTRLVIFVDEVDYVRNLPFRTDEFFAGIRELYNLRAGDEELNRLTFCLLGVATPSDLISDKRITPFNIGHRIELHDFTAAEAAPLARGLGHVEEVNASLLKRVIYWTGGHPYLTQKLCQRLADDESVIDDSGVDWTCEKLFLSRKAREEEDNLQFVHNAMLAGEKDRASLLDIYAKIRRGADIPDDATNPLVGILHLSGIARTDGNWLKVRNRIYERVYDKQWVTSNMPDAELRERHRAFWRGVLRAAIVSGLILALIGSLAVIAIQQRNLAQREAESNRRLLYNSQMRIAQQEWDNANVDRVEEILLKVKPQQGEEDLRGIEWHCLRQLSRQEDISINQEYQVIAVAISPDDKQVATAEAIRTGESQYQLKIHDWGEKEELRRFNIPSSSIFRRVVFGPDLQKALVESENDTARLIDLNSGRTLASFGGHEADLSAIAISSDGKRILTADRNGEAKFWDTSVPQMSTPIKHQEQWIRWASFSPDGRQVVTASETESVKLWDSVTGRELSSFIIEGGAVTAAVFFPDGKKLLTAAKDGRLHILNLRTGQVTFGLAGHSGEVNAMVFSPDGTKFATGSSDRTVKLWGASSRRELTTIKGHGSSVTSIAWSHDGKYLVTGSTDTKVKIWDVEAAIEGAQPFQKLRFSSCLATAFPTPEELIALGVTVDGKVALSKVRIGKAQVPIEPVTLDEIASNILFAVFSPDGHWLVTAGRGNNVKLWDARTGKLHSSLTSEEGTEYIYTAALSSDGRYLVFNHNRNKLKLRDRATDQEVFSPDSDVPLYYSAAFSPDGTRLAVALRDNRVRLWFLDKGRFTSRFIDLSGHEERVRAIVFSKDGMMLATGSMDKSVRLWDAFTGKELKNLGQADVVQRAAFSPDGRRLVTGSYDGMVKIWDVATGQELIVLHKHTAQVTSITFSDDGKSLVTSGADGVVKLWRAIEP